MPADAYTFPLAWRWTRPTHNVLPPEVMSQIAPIPHSPPPPGLTPGGDIDRQSFGDVQETPADCSNDAGTTWLRSLPVPLSQPVTVRWDSSTALRTTWEI